MRNVFGPSVLGLVLGGAVAAMSAQTPAAPPQAGAVVGCGRVTRVHPRLEGAVRVDVRIDGAGERVAPAPSAIYQQSCCPTRSLATTPSLAGHRTQRSGS